MGVAPERTGMDARRKALSGAAASKFFPRLVRFARACGARNADAKDVAQTALLKFWEGDWAWDPQTHPDVLKFLMGIVRSLVANERRSARRKYESPSDTVDALPDLSPTAKALEQRRQERGETALAQLIDSLKGDARALDVVRLVQNGVEKPAKQAAELRCHVQEIYDARDRIQRHVRRIAAALPAVPRADADEPRSEQEGDEPEDAEKEVAE
jgi:DNA-directed RNA polymerase specialized sigma24 family protein